MVSVLDIPKGLAAETLSRYSHAVADLDGTLVRGRVAQGQGKYFLQAEAKRLHLPHVLLGLANYGKAKKAVEKGEAEGLEYFFGVVGRTGCATGNDFYKYAIEYLKKHSLPEAREFMLHVAGVIPTFISTIGSDIAAQAASDYYRCMGYVANPLRYGALGVITGADIKVRDGKDKMEATKGMLAKHRGVLSDGIMIGNDGYDHDLMKASALAVASPLADDATRELVRELNGIVATDYESLLSELDHS